MCLRNASLLIALALVSHNAWPQSQSTYEVILPQIADGILGDIVYTTTFILVNPEREPVQATIELTGDNGDPLGLRLFERGALVGDSFRFTFRIPAGGSRVLETSGAGAGQVGAARIISDSRILASGIFSILDRNGAMITEAGIGNSPPLRSFRLPVDVTGTFSTGVALFNPGQMTADAVLELYDKSGVSIGRSALSLPPGNHVARFADQFFQLTGQIQGSMRVSSSFPLAAIAIRVNSSPLGFTTLPVVAEDSVQTAFNLPQIANGSFSEGKYQTSFLIFSLSGTQASVRIQMTDDNGIPFAAPIHGLGTNSSFDLELPGNSFLFLNTTGEGPVTTGSARITSSAPVGISSIFTIFDGQGNFITETGVGDSLPHTAATLPASVSSNFDTGMALFNPQSSPVDVSMALVDKSGSRFRAAGNTEPAPNFRITLAPGAHLARFVSQFFAGVSDFDGTVGIAASDGIAVLTLRQNNIALSLTTLPVEAGARAPVAGEGTLLNEVGFVSDGTRPQFVELKIAEGISRPAQGLQLVNSEGSIYNLPAGIQLDPQTRLLLILFDAQNRIEGATIHADRSGFLNPASGSVALLNAEGFPLDRIAWGAGQAGAARIGRGGVLYDLSPGSSIARLPDSTGEMVFVDWLSFSTATPGSLNPLPEVGALIPLSGAATTSPDITLSWYPVPGLQSYRVQVSSESTFQAPAIDTEVSKSSLFLTGFKPGEYLWRVQGKTAGGLAAGWSPIESFEILDPGLAAAITLPAASMSLGRAVSAAADSPLLLPIIHNVTINVPLIAQRKDTSMLLLEAVEDRDRGDPTDGHLWNKPHIATDPDDPADLMNCPLATTVMVNQFYGGRLSQDRLGYEFLHAKTPGPEWDLSYGNPGFTAEIHRQMLIWALGLKSELLTNNFQRTPEGFDYFWSVIRSSIDEAGQPIVIWIEESSSYPAHAVVIHGYFQFGDTREVYVRDPFQPGGDYNVWPLRSLEKTQWSRGFWVIPPRAQTNPLSDETSVNADSDRDGVVDFDETNRFETFPNRFDSDGDLISDFLEIRASVFDPDHGYTLQVRDKAPSPFSDFLRDVFKHGGFDPRAVFNTARNDIDEDGKHMERDFDSDGGGCSDGFEDSNVNGRRENTERSNFVALDDECHIQGTERRKLTVPRSSFKLNETLTENVTVDFCAGPPVLQNGNPTSAPNRARVQWTRKTEYKYDAQNFYCAQAFTAAYDFGTVDYVTAVNGGTGAAQGGVTVLLSPLTQGIEATANRTAVGACDRFLTETPASEKWLASFGMWFGIGPGRASPWNYSFLVPWIGIEEVKSFQSGQASSELNIWFVDRSEAEAKEPCKLNND